LFKALQQQKFVSVSLVGNPTLIGEKVSGSSALIIKPFVMLSVTNEKMAVYEHEQPGSCPEKISPQISFDAEFSLPPDFFEKGFLHNCEVCDLCAPPIKERMQPKNDPLPEQTGLEKNLRNRSATHGAGHRLAVILLSRTLPFLIVIIIFFILASYL
jgi:hypothetical protein